MSNSCTPHTPPLTLPPLPPCMRLQMFAKDKKQLGSLLAYHVVPQLSHTEPSKATAMMPTLLDEVPTSPQLACLRHAHTVAAALRLPWPHPQPSTLHPIGSTGSREALPQTQSMSPPPSMPLQIGANTTSKYASGPPTLSWKYDGQVYGGSGSAAVTTAAQKVRRHMHAHPMACPPSQAMFLPFRGLPATHHTPAPPFKSGVSPRT